MTTMHPAAIAFRDPEALRARSELGGFRRLHLRPGYESCAVLPDATWQPLPESYPERFAPSIFTQDSGLIEFFKLPETVTDRHVLAALVGELGDPAPVFLGETDDPPGEPVTHRTPETGLRPGLHVDNHQNLPYAARDTARRRLCVNLGPGSRHVLLSDTDIKSICRTVHDRYETHHPSTDDLRMFVTLRRPLKLLRIRIDPGEGWLAPTAVLPYDESTEGQELNSVTASWLGHWERGLFGPLL
ncbi:hypothetical protein KV557_13790 [Kitasatospora aureofaciens]|uniref:hypothetical protein n=1 Tax=Kitasatospora aureofaciens TaxID=1894 RepID=UPI001C447FAD|nr:hypothetical protein [Kitasatospora aureofaciens]MBV6698198.1 hypothetical protein [Kitasatospora aureofaciens]